MLIKELKPAAINESIELASSLRSIASTIGNPVTAVYNKLEEFAQRWSESHDSMRGFKMVENGVYRRWFEQHGDSLIAELLQLADQAPSQAAAALRRELRTPEMNFRKFGVKIVPILIQIGRDCDYQHLTRNAIAWRKQEQEHEYYMTQLEKYAQSATKKSTGSPSRGSIMSPDRSQRLDRAAEQRRELRGQQQINADALVNNVLMQLSPRVANEIRNAIERDPNKLYALQRELTRHNIKI